MVQAALGRSKSPDYSPHLRLTVFTCMYTCMYVRMDGWMYPYILYIYICMYVCMYACMHVCMYVCMCIYIYMYLFIDTKIFIDIYIYIYCDNQVPDLSILNPRPYIQLPGGKTSSNKSPADETVPSWLQSLRTNRYDPLVHLFLGKGGGRGGTGKE